MLQEIIQDAKANKKTVHFSWFDLTDAFGSISHFLIDYCMKHFNVPEKEIHYINNLYRQLQGKVVNKEWSSDIFTFLKGVFQGDPYSAIIFLMVFQPLLDFLLKHKSHSYKLGNHQVVTLLFADDFEVISNHQTKHQQMVLEVQAKAESIGLEFKASK